MRLDKFLKVSRLVKRRTVASELCRNGRVLVNGKPGKAATGVSAGDILELGLGAKRLKVRVVEVRERASAAEAQQLYEMISEGPA